MISSGHRPTAPFRIGALAPLSPPGWVDAGRHLLAGLELAVGDVNEAGGIAGRPLELLVRDTAASPGRAEAAVEELAAAGVAAIAGEYHSVAARAAAARADVLELPFLCSSAVLDDLIDHPTDWVARIAPVQSHGWRIYADHLLTAGCRRVAVATEPSVYWAAGIRILRAHLEARGSSVIEVDARALSAEEVCQTTLEAGAAALLLLVGLPEPAVSIVQAVRRHGQLDDLLLGAPAGQPELASWTAWLAEDGAAIPFLRYVPDHLGSLGARADRALRQRLGQSPSFVALEGYDTITVLAELLRTTGGHRIEMAAAWPQVSVEGTRGLIDFRRPPGLTCWQWMWPPVQVVEVDPARRDRLRVLPT